jgi:protoporphyrinogen oxidase
MKIAVIGAGITGLSAAYELSKAGHDVELLEKDSMAGGIAGTFEYDGFALEKYYHHFFKSDQYTMELLKELGIQNKIRWLKSSMGFFIDGECYDFGTPVSLLKLKPLSLMDKFKFGTAMLKILGEKDWKKLEDITASEWILKNASKGVYNKIWKPLLVTKFSEQYGDIAMSWLWGKIKLRGNSKEKGKEVLGYIDGSEELMIDRLLEELQERNVDIYYNCQVDSIEKNGQLKVRCGDKERTYDKIICTSPLPQFLGMAGEVLPQGYIKGLSSIEYTAVSCTILILDRQFSQYYWLNIGDESIPFGGLIEHTNLMGTEEYGGNHILYISNYVYKNSPYYSMNAEELLEAYTPYLKRINPDFKKSWVKDVLAFKDEWAQPVIKRGYSRIKPSYETPVPGLYIANMCSIYPEDRGVNYAIREGIASARAAME